MSQPTRPVRSAGGAALCTCLVASTLVAAPASASPPQPLTPAVALTASSLPFTVTVPEILAQVDQFAAFVEPLTPHAEGSDSPDPGLGAVAATAGTPIADGFGQLAAAVLRGLIAPFVYLVRIPALNQLMAGAIFSIIFVGGFAVAGVYGVISQIERVIGGAIAAVGSALSGIVGLPATLLSGATAAGAEGGSALVQRTAATLDDPKPMNPQRLGTGDPERADQRDDDVEQLGAELHIVDEPEVSTDGDPAGPVTIAEEADGTEPEDAGPLFDPDELLSDNLEDEADEEDPTPEPSSPPDETEPDADPAPASPSVDPAPAEREDAQASDEA